MRIFLDSEFTGLQKSTTLLSIGLVTESGYEFYAEFNDYDIEQYSNLIKGGFQPKLDYSSHTSFQESDSRSIKLKESKPVITEKLCHWLNQFEKIEIWADVLAYDWVLFCDLFGGALHLPKNIFYAPFDLSTVFRLTGTINPLSQYEQDINRYQFAGISEEKRHHALEDARVELICFQKLMKNR